jgi:hypothetical protein
LHNDYHLLNPNLLGRYSLGTKNKNLIYNADGSLTLYAGATSPDINKESNWLPAPNGTPSTTNASSKVNVLVCQFQLQSGRILFLT